MKTPTSIIPRFIAAWPARIRTAGVAAIFVLADSLGAQDPGAPPVAPSPPSPAAPQEEAITLKPFEVTADSDTSYGAANSRSITAFNTSLGKMPVSADIFDQAFMQDVGAVTVEDLIQNYSAGAGYSTENSGTASLSQPGDRADQGRYTKLRGMETPNIQRDSLLYLGTAGNPGGTSNGQTNNFDIERVEIINGPNALLYDGGGAGGVINVVSKQARLGAPAFGSLSFRTDQYGTKDAQLDYGASAGHFAVRFAAIDSTDDTRRVNVGGHLTGQYMQLAGEFGNTTVRVSLEQTRDVRGDAFINISLTTTGDKATTPYGGTYANYNGYDPTYLLAVNQAGAFANGTFNWGNEASYLGWADSEDTVAEFGSIEADTQWTSWLSTQLAAGISTFDEDHHQDTGGSALYSPGATANPIPGHWTMGMTGNPSPNDADRIYHGQGLRYSALIKNKLFGGAAQSQTNIGADLVDSRGALIRYAYYQADSDWNVVYNPAVSADLGRTALTKLSWTVDDGPISHPLWQLGAPRITLNGVNYVRMMENPLSAALVTPGNPLGAAVIGGGDEQHHDSISDGVYATNYTNWLQGKLDTLFGARLEHQYAYLEHTPSNLPRTEPVHITDSHSFNFNVGADYHVLPWLAPYFSVADSYLLSPSDQPDIEGQDLPVSHALGEEVGVKVDNQAGTLSGSFSLYHSQAKNEAFQMAPALADDINPSGLNGRFDNSDTQTAYAADSESSGMQLVMTATPTRNWRLRFNAAIASGKIETSRVYGTLYNDQFYENPAGQVTYADGTVVYVASTFNSKTPAYTSATAPAGSVPLSVDLMSTPGGTFYAAPLSPSGQIPPGGSVAKVLEYVDPIHGAILTGATGLPISNYQLNPALSGVSPLSSVPVAVAGDRTVGYPEYSANLTSMYTFSEGWLRGFKAGGSLIGAWDFRSNYYYPNGLSTGGPLAGRKLFLLPTRMTCSGIFGYTLKFRRMTFVSQLNVANVFNHYDVVVTPAFATGFASPAALSAGFSQQPRSYTWTNAVKF